MIGSLNSLFEFADHIRIKDANKKNFPVYIQKFEVIIHFI